MAPEPTATSSQIDHTSKILGALLGVHAGDSLGATLEFLSHRDIKSRSPAGHRDIIGGGSFGWSAGDATDDTDLTRAVLLAYRDRKRVQEASVDGVDFDIVKAAADWSLKWLEGEWPAREKGCHPIDIGGATMTGLSQYAQSRDPRNCGAGPGSAGNGSLMRCIPTALFTSTRRQRIQESMQISAFTHNDARCTVSCAAYNEIVAALIEGKSAEDAVSVGVEAASELECPVVEKAIRRGRTLSIANLAREGPGSDLPDRTSGYVLQSLSVAIAALLDSRALEDVLVDVVSIGGDTDTNGAISGGLLGARDGVGAIPQRWLSTLQFRSEFEDIAGELAATRPVTT